MTGQRPSVSLSRRVRLSVELALSADDADASLRQRQEEEAKALGMTGAEIDAARLGTSFDLRTARAIALALAVSEETRSRALAAGLSRQACAELVWLAGDCRQRVAAL